MGTLLNSNVTIVVDSTMTWSEKINYIYSHLESTEFKVIEPTKRVCEHFKDKIGYCTSSATFWAPEGNKYKVFKESLNSLLFFNYEDLIKYLSDDKKIIYLNRVTLERGIYKAYTYEIDNRPYIRNKILDQLLKDIE